MRFLPYVRLIDIYRIDHFSGVLLVSLYQRQGGWSNAPIPYLPINGTDVKLIVFSDKRLKFLIGVSYFNYLPVLPKLFTYTICGFIVILENHNVRLDSV